jgi:hypothetical protein
MRKSFSCFDLIPHDQPCNIHKKMALAKENILTGLWRQARPDVFIASAKPPLLGPKTIRWSWPATLLP